MGGYCGQFQDDREIEKYFPPSFVGTAIEVGAADGMLFSNTIYFERKGWNVLCVEANPLYEQGLRNCRKNVAMYAVSDYDQDGVPFEIIDLGDNMQACSALADQIDDRLVQDHADKIKTRREVLVKVRTLDAIMKEAGFDSVDLLCIDVEGGERRVLEGFDVAGHLPHLIVIENNYESDRACAEYLAQFGYRMDKRHYVNEFYVRDEND